MKNLDFLQNMNIRINATLDIPKGKCFILMNNDDMNHIPSIKKSLYADYYIEDIDNEELSLTGLRHRIELLEEFTVRLQSRIRTIEKK